MPILPTPVSNLCLALTTIMCLFPQSSLADQSPVPIVLSAKLQPAACRAGFQTVITYRWEAVPLGRDLNAFVHVVGPDWKIMFQDDHPTPVPTSKWAGHVEYSRKLYVPNGTPDGEYKVLIGLYDSHGRQVLDVGPNVTGGPVGEHSYCIAILKVDSHAPLPTLPVPTLDLSSYQITFDDEFSDLSISSDGPAGRWFTATKGNFGDARFVDQKDGFPFSVQSGILPNKNVLRIEASKRKGVWCAGIISSVNTHGTGFSQKFGYFEIRAKMPNSPGMWPAFWLLGQPHLIVKKQVEPEIDAFEWYGVSPNLVFSTLHLWYPNGQHTGIGDQIAATGLTENFHRYGVMIDDQFITYYFDGIATQKQPTPIEAKVPLYMLVDLAMGSGWPIDRAVDPSFLDVDYVRAFAKRRPN